MKIECADCDHEFEIEVDDIEIEVFFDEINLFVVCPKCKERLYREIKGKDKWKLV